MNLYYETLCNLFDSITSKKKGKPDIYAYELHECVVKRDAYGNIMHIDENIEGNAHFLSDIDFTTYREACDFLTDGNFSVDEDDDKEVRYTGEKYALFEMTNEICSELKKVESLSMLTDNTHYYYIPKRSYDVDGQSFHEYKDFLFAFYEEGDENEKMFFGKRIGKLKEYTVNKYDLEED